MDRRIMMLLIGLVFGTGFGFLLAASQGVTLDGHDHATGHGEGGHDHTSMATIDLPTKEAPTLSATAIKDPVAGWNLRLDVTNFTFSPEAAGLAHVAGKGHAHVYANGDKIARLYGPWLHLDHLPTGEVTIEVTLNANSHEPLSVGGQPLRAVVTVQN